MSFVSEVHGADFECRDFACVKSQVNASTNYTTLAFAKVDVCVNNDVAKVVVDVVLAFLRFDRQRRGNDEERVEQQTLNRESHFGMLGEKVHEVGGGLDVEDTVK